jgi:hypothetical protein
VSDFNSSLPVRTQTNGDVVAFLADGTTNTQLLAIDASGRITSKMDDGAGNALTSQVNGTQRALDVGINVAGIQIDPRQIRALTSADVVSVVQSTSPWVSKDQADGPVAPGTAASFSMLIGGQYNSTLPTLTTGQQSAIQVDSSGRLLVTATASFTNDTNYGTVGANTLRTASQIGNATGAANFGAGVTGAQTLRVEANQGASATAANGWFVKPTDGTNSQSYTAAGEAKVSVTQPLPAGTNNIGKVSIQDSSGNAFSPTNPLYVTMDASAGTAINNYKVATVASGGTDNHDYTVSASKTLYLDQIESSASGKSKMEVQIETAAGSGTFTSRFVQFNSTATPNMSIKLDNPIAVATGVRVRVIMSNRDNQSEDLYSTISGNEI